VSFHYRPPHLLLASVLSVGATVLLVVLLGVWLVRRRRRRGARPEPAARGAADPAPEDSPGVVPERMG
jgi:high-affinity Fe2+/Pb2+ permease